VLTDFAEPGATEFAGTGDLAEPIGLLAGDEDCTTDLFVDDTGFMGLTTDRGGVGTGAEARTAGVT